MQTLSPLQVLGSQWLKERDRRYLADPPGFGKSRQLLDAVGTSRLLVVAPATIRDTEVWPSEAAKIGWDGRMNVISYHQLLRLPLPEIKSYDAAIFDEAHHLKNRKVSWGPKAGLIAKHVPRVYEASGTPTPNDASELWAQLRLIRDMPAYWTWIKEWFDIVPTKYTDYGVPGYLKACLDEECHNAPRIRDQDCEHWARFRAETLDGWMLARPEELLDLPPMFGYDTPLDAPMTAAQLRVYRDLKAKYAATMPDGTLIEALSESSKHVQGWMASTGLSTLDPNADPHDRESGKLKLLTELLDDRRTPVVVAAYFRNTASAIERICKRLNKRYAMFGAATSGKARKAAVEDLQDGRIDILVGSVEVIKEGITLTAADGVILVERSWRNDTNYQVVRRVRRRGQDKPVGVRQLVTPRSIDSGQWLALERKLAGIDKVDPVKLWDGVLELIE